MPGGRRYALGSLLFVVLFGAAACGPSKSATQAAASASASVAEPPAPPPGPAEPEKLETGHACASAAALCEGGVCSVTVKNDCESPLTCDAFMLLRCQAGTDIIEAKGRGRNTFPQKSEAKLHVLANCTTGSIVQSSITELTCK